MLTRVAEDHLVHKLITHYGGGKAGVRMTLCGRRRPLSQKHIAQVVQPGQGCHVCLPSHAHPLARVWATCRAWDEDANANTGRNALR